MSGHAEVVRGFIPKKGASNAEAAKALVAELNAKSHESRTMDMLGGIAKLTLVQVMQGYPPPTVLVSVEGHAKLREDVTKSLRMSPDMPFLLAAGADVPPDVSVFFSNAVLGKAERALVESNAIAPDTQTTVASIREAVAKVVPILEKHFGHKLDPAGGAAVLDAIDDIVLKIRPEGLSEDDHVEEDAWLKPQYVLIALGLVAAETMRRLAGGGRFISVSFDGIGKSGTLADVNYFPGLDLGALKLGAAAKVLKRWENGAEDSVEFLWRGSMGELEKHPLPDELKGDGADSAPMGVGEDGEADEEDDDTDGDDKPDDPEAAKTMELLGLAPFSVFMLVAAADGDIEEKELRAFAKRLMSLESMVLKLTLVVGDDPMDAIKKLLKNKDLVKESLDAAAKFVRTNMLEGPAVQRDLVGLARAIAESNGRRAILGLFGAKQLRPQEQMAVMAIENWLSPK